MQADHLREFRQARQVHPDSRKIVYAMFARADQIDADADPDRAPHGVPTGTEGARTARKANCRLDQSTTENSKHPSLN
jgi:hypothetical protein